MNGLNLEVIRRAAGMSQKDFMAILLRGNERARDEKRSDVMLMGLKPAVGAVTIQPQYVGGVAISPYYPGSGRVGAPAVMSQGALPGQQAVNYTPQAFNAADTTWFGFGATSIPALSTGTNVTVLPPRPIVPQQMYCPSTVQGLLISQVSIAGTNIFDGVAGVPIELLSEVSNVPQIAWPTLDPSNGVTFVLLNPTAGALTFSGAIYGTQVRQ